MFTIAKYTYRDITRSFYFNFLVLLGAFLLYTLPYMLFFYFKSYNIAFRDISLSTIYSFLMLIMVISFPYNIHTEAIGDYFFLMFSKPLSRTRYLLGKFCGFAKTLLVVWIFLVLIFFFSLWKAEGKEIFEKSFKSQIAVSADVNAFAILWNYIKIVYVPLLKICLSIYLFATVFSSFMLLWLVHFRFMTNILFSIIMIFLINILFSLPSDNLKSILGLILPDIGFFDFFYFNKFIFKSFSIYTLKGVKDVLDLWYMAIILLKTILYCVFYITISGYIWAKKEIKVSD